MSQAGLRFLRLVAGSFRDLAPIVIVIAFFQIAVLRQPIPDFGSILVGIGLLMAGLTMFIHGLNMSLFPIGQTLAEAFAQKGSLAWLLAFAFALGFGTTAAEPAMISVTAEAARAASSSGFIADTDGARGGYALGLRLTVALAVGAALVLGVFRILKGWPVHMLMIGGYGIVVALTMVAPPEIVGIAYDLGGVTTSSITVPLVTALGIGLASVIKGRSPLVDGFGLIALASLTPMILVLVYGILVI